MVQNRPDFRYAQINDIRIHVFRWQKVFVAEKSPKLVDRPDYKIKKKRNYTF